MIQDINQYIHDEFQWFHRHPELSFKEIETTKRIRQDLQKGGLHILNLPLETGVVAEVGTGKHPIVAIRCDIDALPVTEKADVPHRSEHPDCMHACGHDFHTASILGAAYLLKAREADIQGTIRIIFQPGEEGPSGALKIIETGIIDDVDAILECTARPFSMSVKWGSSMVRPWRLSMLFVLLFMARASMQLIRIKVSIPS